MDLLDVNVLLYAAMPESPEHPKYKAWLDSQINGSAPFGLCDPVLSAFLRIATNARVFKTPLTIDEAIRFLEVIRLSPQFRLVLPGAGHWKIFIDLCRGINAAGNVVPDAYLAALAIEHGHEFVTNDQGFRRFVNLKWRTP